MNSKPINRIAIGEKKTINQRERWRDFFEIIILVVLLALFLRTFILGIYRISLNDMSPSLISGDFIWVSKISYGFKLPFSNKKMFEKIPEKGDLVLVQFFSGTQSFKKIMRVLAHPGDYVEIKNQQLLVNEQTQKKFDQPQPVTNEKGIPFEPLVVPPGEVLVMVDHIDDYQGISRITNKMDGNWAVLSLNQIEAKVKGIWFSIDWTTSNPFSSSKSKEAQPRWNRVGIVF